MLIAFNKPFNVLCQFTDRSVPPRPTLSGFGLPPRVYAAGRLDHDSEGLLLLTDNGTLAHTLTDPKHKADKTYWVQVEGTPSDEQLQRLRDGVELNDGPTLPAKIERLDPAPSLWTRDPPVRFRKTVPDAWLAILTSAVVAASTTEAASAKGGGVTTIATASTISAHGSRTGAGERVTARGRRSSPNALRVSSG